MTQRSEAAIDPEILVLLDAVAAPPPVARGDWRSLRAAVTANLEHLSAGAPELHNISVQDFEVETGDGHKLSLRWYAKDDVQRPASVVLYVHGGGRILGCVDLYDPVVKDYVNATGVSFLSVEYRLSPEVSGAEQVEDVFAALTWLIGNADELRIDPTRIAIMGDSAGGGIAAGTAILARDQSVQIAKQILIYPMLDDTNIVPTEPPAQFATWSHDDNFTGWSAAIGSQIGNVEVPPIVAPARLTDPEGLPPAYIEVGSLDIFCAECICYAQKLLAARIPVELHVHSGVPHGFERWAVSTRVAQRAMADRYRVIADV
ncbi:alpha/beta hydrolase [Agrobacterium radiobacter]|uniref:alpha/beta hydrolase n=1 Tax=Agrobacterium radiobacter TaxID=362 RepID=UPI003F877AAB